MRDFHRKGCAISRGVYYQVKGLMMDYDRLKCESLDLLYGSQYTTTGLPHGSEVGIPTEQRAMKRLSINSRLDAVDQAAELMRGERGYLVGEDFDPIKAYWSYDYFNFQHMRTEESPNGPCRRTWNNFKDRFSEAIARRLELF